MKLTDLIVELNTIFYHTNTPEEVEVLICVSEEAAFYEKTPRSLTYTVTPHGEKSTAVVRIGD